MSDWAQHAREFLIKAGEAAPVGWGYRGGAAIAVEPTVLACLALLATDPTESDRRTTLILRNMCRALADFQKPDGSVGIGAGIPKGFQQPDWTTTYAVFLWSTRPEFESQRARACDWLIQLKGDAVAHTSDNPVGDDTTLVGWPWVAGTHSWLEPTAMAVLALRHEGRGAHPRVREGLKLIRDRAVPTGGWNYGNSSVFGNSLRAQPAPTGQALLALVGVAARDELVDKACEYLLRAVPKTRAPQSLSWGVLGMSAWSRRPKEAEAWLEEAYKLEVERRQPPYLVALLLLAARPAETLNRLGLASGAASPASPVQEKK